MLCLDKSGYREKGQLDGRQRGVAGESLVRELMAALIPDGGKMYRSIVDKQTRKTAEKVLRILERDDGSSFEEKKAEAMKMLGDEIGRLGKARGTVTSEETVELGEGVPFWDEGEDVYADGRITLRRVRAEDREKYIEVQKENTIMPFMFKDEGFVESLWKMHIESTALMCSVVGSGTREYLGYCGIKNVCAEKWEVAIELLKEHTGQGIGTLAVRGLLDAVVRRCGVTEFRIRIDPDNYASQGMFEKLGALPNGISEFLLHGTEDIRDCEEENLGDIDEDLVAVADKFHVEPRALLSHVLEYKLIWRGGDADCIPDAQSRHFG